MMNVSKSFFLISMGYRMPFSWMIKSISPLTDVSSLSKSKVLLYILFFKDIKSADYIADAPVI